MIKPTSKHIYAIATMDTKGEEIAYIAQSLRLSGAEVVTVDVGTAGPPTCAPDIDRTTVAECHLSGQKILSLKDRGEAVTAMGEALAIFLANENAEGRLSGAIGIGGAIRWEDEAATGYVFGLDPETNVPIPDVNRPHFDNGLFSGDLWLTYGRKIWDEKIDWSVRLNVRNLVGESGNIPVKTNPDGQVAVIRIPPPRTIYLSNSFKF